MYMTYNSFAVVIAVAWNTGCLHSTLGKIYIYSLATLLTAFSYRPKLFFTHWLSNVARSCKLLCEMNFYSCIFYNTQKKIPVILVQLYLYNLMSYHYFELARRKIIWFELKTMNIITLFSRNDSMITRASIYFT